MPIPILPILAAAAQIVPGIAKWAGGDKAEKVAEGVVTLAADLVPGVDDPLQALKVVAQKPDLAFQFEEGWQNFELGIQQELTKRHQADMASDSRLAQNVRPLCLLGLTLAVMAGVWLPDQYVSSARYTALLDLSQWVYGYYFVGRSTEKAGGFAGLRGVFGGGK